jgi:hypothetical protein
LLDRFKQLVGEQTHENAPEGPDEDMPQADNDVEVIDLT